MQYTSREVYEYVSQKTNDPIIERRTCAVSGAEFPIYQSDVLFYDKISPTFNGTKYQIPYPTLCPEERQRRRLLFRNERKLYKRKCDATGEGIVSIYSPDKPYKVYNQKFWWSDARNPMIYGKDFDDQKTFNQQFGELLWAVPKQNLANNNCENADYGNNNTDVKDCYMCFSTGYSQNCYHLNVAAWSENSIDGYRALHSKDSYEIIDSDNIVSSQYIVFSNNISSSSYLYDCENCESCHMCAGLRNKKYMVLNKEYSPENYSAAVLEASLDMYQELLRGYPKYNGIKRSEGCLGQNIKDSHNCILCTNVNESEDCRYCYSIGLKVKDCYDCGGNIFQLAKSYESAVVYLGHTVGFSYNCQNVHHVLYCYDCYNSSDLFGCVGLRDKQYCVFNKQYSKEDYEKKVSEIITHMQQSGERGEFLNPKISLFGYNETMALDHFSYERDEALSKGYARLDKTYDPVIPEGSEALYPGYFSPAERRELLGDDEVLKRIIVCDESGRPFRIIKQELEFYRKHSIDIPKQHPDVRHQKRLAALMGDVLYLRKCDKTGEDLLSVYPVDYIGRVYSEEAYEKEICG